MADLDSRSTAGSEEGSAEESTEVLEDMAEAMVGMEEAMVGMEEAIEDTEVVVIVAAEAAAMAEASTAL